MTAVLTFIGLVLAVAVSAATLYRLIRTDGKLDEVHVLVNSQLAAVLARVAQLTLTIEKADIEVPPEPPPPPVSGGR